MKVENGFNDLRWITSEGYSAIIIRIRETTFLRNRLDICDFLALRKSASTEAKRT